MVVGLGNPGREYRHTRHNLGWMVLDRIASPTHFGDFRRVADVARQGDVLLVKPTLFMNRSGEAVSALKEFYKVETASLLVVYDDLNLPLGMLRARAGGSSGGHRGVESVIERLGTEQFARIRLGIGPVPGDGDARDYVLSGFGSGEQPAAERMVEQGREAVELWLREGIVSCMNVLNRRIASTEPNTDAEAPDAAGSRGGDER